MQGSLSQTLAKSPAQAPSTTLKSSIAIVTLRVLVLPEEARKAFLQELIRDAEDRINKGFVLGVVGLLFTFFGFFLYINGLLGFSLACFGLGIAGVAMGIVAICIMVRSDKQKGMWKRELGNIDFPESKGPEPVLSAHDNDEYFDEDYEDWKNPFDEDEE